MTKPKNTRRRRAAQISEDYVIGLLEENEKRRAEVERQAKGIRTGDGEFYAIRRRQVLGQIMSDYRMAAGTATNTSGLLTATKQVLTDKNCEANTLRFSMLNLLEACEEVMALDTSITAAHGRLKRAMEDAMGIVT